MENSYEGSNDLTVESQATQLINHVLGGGLESPPNAHRQSQRTTPITVEHQNSAQDSYESSPSSFKHVTSKFNYHGLAATQTQHEGNEDNEGSQKENAPSSGDSKGATITASYPASTALTSPTKLHRGDLPTTPFNKATLPPLFVTSAHASASKTKPIKAVSFQSPRGSHTPALPKKPVAHSKTMPSRHHYRRSLSQDSFGGQVSQDPEEEFLVSNKQFEVPLSELGNASSQESPPKPQHESTDDEAGPSFSQAFRSAYQVEKEMQSAPSHGVILVASTPSHSRSSNGGLSQIHRSGTQESTQPFDADSEPSSSYERLINGEPSDVPTQLDDDSIGYPETQISNEVSNSNGQASWQTPAAPPSLQSAAPRSLVAMSGKPWRAARYGMKLQEQPESVWLPDMSVIEDIYGGDTQPSSYRAGSTNSPTKTAKDSRTRNQCGRAPLLSPSRSDAMEIVPDSEPPQPATTPSTSARPLQLTPPPYRKPLIPEPILVDEDISNDDDDEEIPLAVVRASKARTTSKGKGKEVVNHLEHSRRGRSGSIARHPPAAGRSWETTEVPSSAPEQDASTPTNNFIADQTRRPNFGRNNAGKPPSTTSSRNTRSTSIASSIPTKKRRLSSDTEDDDELRLITQDQVFHRKAEREEDEETEPADEDGVLQDTVQETKPTIRKRKRESKPKPGPKVVPKITTRLRSTPTFTRSPTKGLRSVTSTGRAAENNATRVFALWKSDACYYPGTVHSFIAGTKYRVDFDDDTNDIVEVSKMRRYEVKANDEVLLPGKDRGVVREALMSGPGHLLIQVDDGDELETHTFRIQEIRIASKTVGNQWQDRLLNAEELIPIIKPANLGPTPTPSKSSILSAASGKSKTLCKNGFVITMSSKNENWEKDRLNLVSTIKSHGGTVIEDWSDILRMDGKHSLSNKRWAAYLRDVDPVFKDGFDRVFLLADEANMKPKYLIALALGVPCLSIQWIQNAVENSSEDWQSHLLPAGFCEQFETHVSQIVDWHWGSSSGHLSDIMVNPVARKIFVGQTVLLVGPDFLPAPKSKNNAEGKESTRNVYRIILSMGAEHVEVVGDIKDSSKSEFDYVIVKDPESGGGIHKMKFCRSLVHLPWVKACLIAGRLLDRPKWT